MTLLSRFAGAKLHFISLTYKLLAIFFSFKPAVLFLDEPTSALDDFTAQELLSNIKEFAKNNKTNVIVISHNKKLIDLFADDTIYLSGKEKL